MVKIALTAKDVLRLLDGFLCVYKPRDVTLQALKKLLVAKLCEEGNLLATPDVPTIEMPVVKPHPESQANVVVGTRTQLDYRLHPMMGGRLFRPEDFRVEELDTLEKESSGVCLLGIGSAVDELDSVADQAWINEYRLDGELGVEHEDNGIRARVTNKAEYGHVTRAQIEKLFSRLRAQYKKVSFEYANVDMQSEEAFEIARRGAPRPKILGSPIVYNLALKKFETPHFALSMQVACENGPFLRGFINDVGVRLGSTACPRKIRRRRLGPFTVDHALLDKQLTLTTAIRNIQMCNKIVRIAKTEGDVVEMKKENELESKALLSVYKLDPESLAKDPDVIEEPDCLRIPWGRNYS